MGPTDRAAGSGQPTATEGVLGRARGGGPAAQPATEPSVTRRGRSTAVGPRRFAAFAAARGPASHHRRPPPVAGGGAHAELLRGSRQVDRRGSMAIDRGRTPLAPEDDLPQGASHAHSLSGLRHRVGKSLAPLGGRADRRTLYRLGPVRRRRLLERHRFRRQPDDRVSA